MPARIAPIVILIIALLIALTAPFTINEGQVAIRTEFGAIVGLDYSPGLHWKWPWDQVVKFDRRVLSQSYTGRDTFRRPGAWRNRPGIAWLRSSKTESKVS